MTHLSVNINKIATLRNARGGNMPDVQQFAIDCCNLGAEGITVHPRPDERHITRRDVYMLKDVVTTEFNIEGNPTADFTRLVTDVCPTQVTLVPDNAAQLTSDHGWDTKTYYDDIVRLIAPFKEKGIRVSVFVDAEAEMVSYAAKAGVDRVELYTGPFAHRYAADPEGAIQMLREAALEAKSCGLGLNAGHDLNLTNLHALAKAYPWIDEVSIGHALISDALYLGIAETIKQYKACLIINE